MSKNKDKVPPPFPRNKPEVIQTSKTLNSEREALIFMMAYNLGAQSDSELSSARIDPEEPFTILLDMTTEEEEIFLDDEHRKALGAYPSVIPGPAGQLPDVSKLNGKELLDIYLEGLEQAEPGKLGFGPIHEAARRRLEGIGPEQQTIVIHLDGGLVQEVYSEGPMRYVVADTDEDLPDNEALKVPEMLWERIDRDVMSSHCKVFPSVVDIEAVKATVEAVEKANTQP